MTVTEFIKNQLMLANQAYADKAPDHFDYWEQHVQFVVKEALLLADRYGADKEIVELGALLHDIALISEAGLRKEHHLNGRQIADELLSQYGYPEDRKERVLGCVVHHQSSKYAENMEELCVAGADILSHFDNIPMCFGAAFKYKKINTGSITEWMKYFESDYNDLSQRTKQFFRPRYEAIMNVLFGDGRKL